MVEGWGAGRRGDKGRKIGKNWDNSIINKKYLKKVKVEIKYIQMVV